jgi:tRNA A-37 threonylcarbamoyl transferase component Bud32/tetratricopeptide (TPR) repeat protein
VEDLRARLAAALSGRYTIEREIGRGGMSIVYLARDLRNERRVALKVLRPDIAHALGSDRFLREIKVAAGLTHPHILPLFDSDVADGLLFYTMPYVEGESLRHRLQREGRLPVADAVRIARDVADALAYAHSQNIVHRDIKPENILIEAGHPVVSDFGIARAISAANESRMTGSGIVVGTFEYMSPEQAAGDELDGRSDVYSLACVLYEMLAGRTPVATSPSGQVPALSDLRRDIPIDIEFAIQVGLARLPSERFATARAFADALGPMETTTWGRGAKGRVRRWGAIAAGTALMLGTMGLILVPRYNAAKLDASLYVVVPFGHRSGAAPALVNGDQCELLLAQAFGRWTDVRLADPLRVHDARMRRGAEPMTLEEAKTLARTVGAGMLVWGDVSSVGDSIQVTAALYDLRHGGKTVRDYTVRIHKDGQSLEAKFRELADSILLGGVNAVQLRPDVVGTDVLAAFYAYADGRAALARWDLAGAEHAFQVALDNDPTYPQASLWLAHVQMWNDEPLATWQASAARALISPSKLGSTDLALARALWSLGTGQFPEACDRYRRIIDQRPADFVAWFGLGQCQSKDRAVERDAGSPSGWRFRSSYNGAVQAYRRALQLIPSAHRAFGRFSRLSDLIFFTETNQVRAGYVLTPDTQWYGALPSLDHDTLAFVPYRLSDVFAAKPEAIPTTTAAAVAHNRAVLRDITTQWVRAFPNSPEANEALALVLESTGDLADPRNSDQSALSNVRRARAATSAPDDRLRLGIIEVRLLVKLEDFAAARRLADSLLDAAVEPDAGAAEQMAGLAVLTGRAHRAAQLLSRAAPNLTVESDGRQIIVRPLSLATAAFALRGYAALGAPAESITTLARRVNVLIDASVEPQRRDAMRYAILSHPIQWAMPLLPAQPPRRGTAGERERRLVWALEHHDTLTIRATLDTVHAARADLRPGDVAISGTYLEARVLLAIGDTAAATELIRRPLEAMATLGTLLLDDVNQAGALVRAMALRADLASREGDAGTARHWAAPVVELWANADDPELQATWERMRRLTVPGKP